MTFEKPQKSNPHALTVNQHCFPLRSISRFTDIDRRIAVDLIQHNKVVRLAPDNNIFCAKRVWDQRAESGYMKDIEDKYQNLADSIIAGSTKTIDFFLTPIVNDMFALWNIRTLRRQNPIEDQKINALGMETELTKDEQEIFEKNRIGFARPDLTIPGRQLSGIHIQTNLIRVRKQLKDAEWGILVAGQGEFIVPDIFSNARVLPVSPTICLYSPSENDIIDVNEVRGINRLAIASSKEYFFARDFAVCPA